MPFNFKASDIAVRWRKWAFFSRNIHDLLILEKHDITRSSQGPMKSPLSEIVYLQDHFIDGYVKGLKWEHFSFQPSVIFLRKNNQTNKLDLQKRFLNHLLSFWGLRPLSGTDHQLRHRSPTYAPIFRTLLRCLSWWV